MMEIFTIKDALDLGSNGLLTFFLFKLWTRLNEVTDVLIENGKQASAERLVIAKMAGVNTEDLTLEALKIRRKLGNEQEH